jgi:hypothetical protein
MSTLVPRAVLLCRRHDDAAVAAAEVVQCIAATDLGDVQHFSTASSGVGT